MSRPVRQVGAVVALLAALTGAAGLTGGGQPQPAPLPAPTARPDDAEGAS